jgi:hypothetical protein
LISYELDRDKGILIVRPEGALDAADFDALTREVDPYIEANGKLRGLMVEAPSFPGWESFGALVGHLKFVRNHHRKIARVAVVTESPILRVAPRIAAHFADPEIRVFTPNQVTHARAWLEGRPDE